MKKSIIFALILLWSLTSCSINSSDVHDTFGSFLKEWDLLIYQESVCPSDTDAFIFPENWTVEDLDKFALLPVETFSDMSTCGLLETLLNHPQNFSPWFATSISNELYIPGFTIFNENLRVNNVAVELFKRDDFFTVLASKYISFLKVNRDKQSDRVAYLEILLASDMCMALLNESEKYQLVAMALERTKYDVYIVETRHIMAVIMRDCNYTPFMNEVGTEWIETLSGYSICHLDVVEKHAKQFLKDKNHIQ